VREQIATTGPIAKMIEEQAAAQAKS
jgi:hypothetical protein